jgi:Protein of unknown function (DUF1579)
MSNHEVAETPKRGVEHKRLGVFVGKWHSEGDSYAVGQTLKDPRGKVEKWVSDETVEWVPGQFFIIQHSDGTVGKRDVKGIDIFNYVPEAGRYATRAYENHGYFREYATQVDGDIWTFTGDTERARVEFTDAGDKQKVFWEWRKPGEAWLPLCDRVSTRVGQPHN